LVKENKYDDLDFFAKYVEMPRSVGGLGQHLFRKDPPGRRKPHPSRAKKTDTHEAAIEYRLCAIEAWIFPPASSTQ
jgi:hypothetical protein